MNTGTPLWRTFLIFLGPMVASNILQALSGTINSVYYGQMIGVQALAAATAFFPVLFFFISFLIGLGVGASVLIGQAFGARDFGKLKAISGTVFVATFILGIGVTVLGLAFLDPLLSALATPDDIRAMTRAYAVVSLIGAPLLFVFLMFTIITRGVGDTVTPMIALAISTAVGLVVTPALIQGWLGLPGLGVQSAAYAMIVSNLVAMAWVIRNLLRRNHPLAPDAEFLRQLRIDGDIFRRILRIGIPTGLQMIAVSLSEVVLLSFVNAFGSDATAACGAVNQIMSYVQFPAMSIAITASVLGAQAIGAGRNERLGAITRTGVMLNVVITGALVLIGYALSRTILGSFITGDPAVIELAEDVLHIVLWSLVIFGIAATLSGVMRSTGTVLWPTALQIGAILLVEIPVAYLLSAQIGVTGVWIAYPAVFVAMMLLQTTYYRLFWRKKSFSRLI